MIEQHLSLLQTTKVVEQDESLSSPRICAADGEPRIGVRGKLRKSLPPRDGAAVGEPSGSRNAGGNAGDPYSQQGYYASPTPPPQPLSPPPLTWRNFRRDLLTVCLVLSAFILSMNIGAIFIASALIMFDPEVLAIVMQAAEQADLSSATNLLNDQVYMDAVQAAMTRSLGPATMIAMVLSCAWMFILRGKKLFTTDIKAHAAKLDVLDVLKAFAIIFAIQLVVTILEMIIAPVMEAAGLSATEALEQGTAALASSPLGIISAVLVGPFVEELVFRGAVLRKLSPYGANVAIVVSAMLFGLYHMILVQAVLAFALGLVLGMVAHRYSIVWSFVLHAANNGIAVLFLLLDLPDVVYLGFMVVCTLVAILVFTKDRPRIKGYIQEGRSWLGHPFVVAYSSRALIVTSSILLILCFATLGLG